MKPLTPALFGLLAALSPAFAQEPGSAAPRPSQPAVDGEWMLPLHTMADDPEGGRYGTWAAGPDYKAAFDDGFTFYPVLGETYPDNLPLRWRTDTITVGGAVLVDGSAQARRNVDEWRYELRYGAVTEAYDIRRDGVEQTFVLQRDTGAGDVVVSGVIDTPLHSANALAAVQSLSFVDGEGRPVIRYGEALAFDARDRRIPVQTSFDGERIQLRLDGAWLAGATYPVTIDPLTSSTVIVAGGGFVNYPNLARDGSNNRIMAVFSRPSSGSDYDLYGKLLNDDLTFVASAFSDVTASWSTRYASVAYAQSADKWMIALGRENLPGAGVRVYFHSGASTSLNTGNIIATTRPSGYQDQHPSIGGNSTDTALGRGYLVFRRDQGSGSPNEMHSRVYGVVVQPQTESFGVQNNLHTAPGFGLYDAEWPCVTRDNGGLGSWAVAWQEQDHTFGPGEPWVIVGHRVGGLGQLSTSTVLVDGGRANSHKLHPQVSGAAGRYLLSYVERDNVLPFSHLTGDAFYTQRFDWPNAAAAPTVMVPRSVLAPGGNGLRTNLTNRAIAFDSDTESHWAVTYRTVANDLYIARLGMSGRVVESGLVYADPTLAAGSASVCYNPVDHEFAVVFGTQLFSRLEGRHFTYQPAANTVFGTACGPLTIAGQNRGKFEQPFAGSEFFELTLNGLPNAPSALFVSLAQAPGRIPVGGCSLLLDPNASFQHVLTTTTNVLGRLTVPVPLPDTITNADVFWQFFQYDVAQARLLASEGLQTSIR